MKPAILVISHPNTSEKDYILKDFGNFISQYKIDHYLITNYPANKETQLEFKASHYTSYNPEGKIGGVVWHEIDELKHNKRIPNWCYAVMNLYLKGFKLLKEMGYTHVYAFTYDVEPSFPKILDYIQTCNNNFKLGKKAIFTKYPEPLLWTDKNNLDRNAIDTIHLASEVDFFINTFEKGCFHYINDNFQDNPDRSLCENYWFHMLENYKSDIEILPIEKALKGIFNSALPTTIEGVKYFIGYYQNKILFKLLKPINSSIEIRNSKKEIVSCNIIDEKTIEFEGSIKETFYLNDSYLFTDSELWRKNNYFEKKSTSNS